MCLFHVKTCVYVGTNQTIKKISQKLWPEAIFDFIFPLNG